MTFNLLYIFISVLVFASTPVFADPLDDFLYDKLKIFRIGKYETPAPGQAPEYQARIELGRKLFMDPNLSGNKNISCLTCHHPMKGLSDALALSQTEDGKGILKRGANSLYNIGDRQNNFMFWDGRVHYSPTKKVFTTPEVSLNGPAPVALHITGVLQSALSAQALFPLVSHEEMRGRPGTNEVADAKNNLEAWELIVKRITGEKNNKYLDLFSRAYPDTHIQKINIGHVGEAMAVFMRESFQSKDSPFHRYAAGDVTAMTVQQKRGLQVFMTSNCMACHSGPLLGNNALFASVGVPSFGARPFVADRGRGEIDNQKFRSFFFKTPSLINVSLSAPYMHNGAFKTLREVINHYNNIENSLATFDISKRRTEFPVEVELLNSPGDINAIWTSVQAGFLRNGLGLGARSLDDLEVFLKEALTDPKWNPQHLKWETNPF